MTFVIKFETDIKTEVGGAFEVVVDPADAPIGAARLKELVEDGFFDDGAFFRVVPGFVVQFGIAADPMLNDGWEALKDEPRKLSNTEGTLCFASSGENTRTTQLFFNTECNSSKLDDKGFTPIGTIKNLEDGLEILRACTNPTPDDKSGIDQQDYETKGNEWLLDEHPEVNMITRAYIC
eukprot:TRINITY_DN21003_c0_g1_i1.p1 TRINITY_DN21003_c0_g1~~TRINITY_DN21003_c0_g1_i1.p1  ORF type:complete len:179 (+),score=37.96 TRINITY_DN21003_c0_g1_i1:111-647(+)